MFPNLNNFKSSSRGIENRRKEFEQNTAAEKQLKMQFKVILRDYGEMERIFPITIVRKREEEKVKLMIRQKC